MENENPQSDATALDIANHCLQEEIEEQIVKYYKAYCRWLDALAHKTTIASAVKFAQEIIQQNNIFTGETE